MKKPSIILGLLLALASPARSNLDVVTLPTRGDAWIQEASATLVVGNVPNPMTGDVALWSAIMTDKGDFLQGVTENVQSSPWCRNLGRNWCSFAYTFSPFSTVQNGSPVICPPGSRIKTHYKMNSTTGLWDQKLYLNDIPVSQVSTSKNYRGTIFYFSVECAAGTCAPAPAHSWESVSITLAKPDPSFAHKGIWAYGATGGVMSTADGGKTWNLTTLYVPETRPT
ncbi:hypothetical protein C8A05DRAFT_46824 [Staphylotrichum tortipilum]|uniref:Exo-alpha-sialidase n=1 Tax=Staphylotrichum tortipilum TaxID=2831512 RepID=A0AAN6RQF0_9PEZI|nr:hypothetical protein C8A05DRAFT_46824 [Staphylotrichum longicolle]